MSRITLYILKSERYFEDLIDILKKNIKNKNVIYITTNKPYNHIVSVFKKQGVSNDKILFIDCISKHVGLKEEPINAIFVESPQNLTTISIAVNESAKNLSGEKLLLLDSVSTLLIYNDANTIARFANFLINKMRTYSVDTIIFVLESDINKDIIKQIESFADEVIKND